MSNSWNSKQLHFFFLIDYTHKDHLGQFMVTTRVQQCANKMVLSPCISRYMVRKTELETIFSSHLILIQTALSSTYHTIYFFKSMPFIQMIYSNYNKQLSCVTNQWSSHSSKILQHLLLFSYSLHDDHVKLCGQAICWGLTCPLSLACRPLSIGNPFSVMTSGKLPNSIVYTKDNSSHIRKRTLNMVANLFKELW